MPRRDGSGPWGEGVRTGRGFGPCGGGGAYAFGPRCARVGWSSRGSRGMGPLQGVSSLQEYKEVLKNELKWVNEELDQD